MSALTCSSSPSEEISKQKSAFLKPMDDLSRKFLRSNLSLFCINGTKGLITTAKTEMKGLIMDNNTKSVINNIRDIESQNLKAVPACHLILLCPTSNK